MAKGSTKTNDYLDELMARGAAEDAELARSAGEGGFEPPIG